MRSVNYIAYGSNLHVARIQQRLDAVAVRGVVPLPGWSLKFNKRGTDGSAKCNLMVAARATAFGVVYEISVGQKILLDRIEGLGKGYDEHWLSLPAFGDAYFYRASVASTVDDLRPYSWYKSLVVAGAQFHVLPSGYIDAIEAIVAAEDPDRERHRGNLALVGVSRKP